MSCLYDRQEARVHYWLDREYVDRIMKDDATRESCVAAMQKEFPWVHRFKLEQYLDDYIREGEEAFRKARQ